MDVIADIKKALKENKLVFGKDETLKGLRTGRFAKLYLASNCPAQLREDIMHYTKIANVEIVETGLENVDLGDVCKKPFSVAVIALAR